MNCPNCGAQFQEGTFICPNCGMQFNYNTGNYSNADAYYGFNNNFYGNTPQTLKKKFPTAALVAIIIIIAAAIGVGAFFIIKSITKNNEKGSTKAYAGTYAIDSMNITYMGETMVVSKSDIGLKGDEMQFIIGSNGDLTVISDGQKGSGTVEFNGDTVTLSNPNDSNATFIGKYNTKDNTISISFKEFTKYLAATNPSSLDSQDLQTLEMFDDITLIFKKQ